MHSAQIPSRLLPSLLLLPLVACAAEAGSPPILEGVDHGASALTASERKVRAREIRDAAAARGLQNGFLLAGIADAETRMSHCWSELTWACQGPSSPDCGGGPVVAGAGDGPCYLKEGGLGMFQFDAGKFDDTLRREGNRVLSIAGNTQAAVDFVVNMVVNSAYIAGVSTRGQALAWMNGVRVDNSRFNVWIKTVTHYYNGCKPSYSCYTQRFSHYKNNAIGVWNEMGGAAFWLTSEPLPPPPASVDPIEVYWSRQADGSYDLRALAPGNVEKVVYEVDGWPIGSATRDGADNFPARYRFSSETSERQFEVLGYDDENRLIAKGVGLLDVTDGTGVYVRQMGDGLYEIGLERAPSSVAAIEVKVDGKWTLTDEVSGDRRSTRHAVRSTFSRIGERDFTISTYNADGSWRGALYRTFTLR